MIRMYSPRSVCGTTKRLPRVDFPNRTNRSSPTECSASGIVIESQSANAVSASSNETPCFFRFSRAFFGSHSNFTSAVYSSATIFARARAAKHRGANKLPPRCLLLIGCDSSVSADARGRGQIGATASSSARSALVATPLCCRSAVGVHLRDNPGRYPRRVGHVDGTTDRRDTRREPFRCCGAVLRRKQFSGMVTRRA